MSDFFEIFNPGLRYKREQDDLEKILLVEPAVADGLTGKDLEALRAIARKIEGRGKGGA